MGLTGIVVGPLDGVAYAHDDRGLEKANQRQLLTSRSAHRENGAYARSHGGGMRVVLILAFVLRILGDRAGGRHQGRALLRRLGVESSSNPGVQGLTC
jgi:hypothetical protein